MHRKNAVTFKEMTELTADRCTVQIQAGQLECTCWSSFPDLSSIDYEYTQANVDRMNYFLGLNIADSPSIDFPDGDCERGPLLMMIAAILDSAFSPLLTQWLNTKLMSTQNGTLRPPVTRRSMIRWPAR